MALTAEERRLYIGLAVFGTVAGAGLYVVTEHVIWGSVLILIGMIGFVYAIATRNDMANRPLVWTIALVLTWAAIAYDRYGGGLDSDIPEEDPNKVLVYSWGGVSGQGPEYLHVEVNGDRFFPYRERYHLVAVAFLWDGLSDMLDAPNLQPSAAYEPAKGHMALTIRLSPSFMESLHTPLARGGLHFAVLMVPVGVEPGSLNTLRQARV